MKRIFDWLRQWLIVKLGGYTKQHICTYRQINNYTRRGTLHVSFEVGVNFEWLGHHRNEVWMEVKRELAEKIATELLKRDAILFTTSPEDIGGCCIVRADLEVVAGKDLAWDGIATVGLLDAKEMEAVRYGGVRLEMADKYGGVVTLDNSFFEG